MFVIEIMGGLGNQMFCYAFAQAIKHHYQQPIKLFTGRYADMKDNQGYELARIFDIEEPIIDTYKEVSHLTDFSMNFSARLRRKIFGVKSSYYTEKRVYMDEAVFKLSPKKDVFFEGLWQDCDYLKDIRNILVDKFKFIPELDSRNAEIVSQMQACNSISLHVRRGDYVNNPQYMGLLGGVCNNDYYEKGMELIEKKEKDLTYFIFSDDIPWVKENLDFLKERNVIYIDHNKGLDSYKDMQLMSNCKHNIIANSTFSWWGAWLNANPKKKVIAPAVWFMNDKKLSGNHIVPDEWTQVIHISFPAN